MPSKMRGWKSVIRPTHVISWGCSSSLLNRLCVVLSVLSSLRLSVCCARASAARCQRGGENVKATGSVHATSACLLECSATATVGTSHREQGRARGKRRGRAAYKREERPTQTEERVCWMSSSAPGFRAAPAAGVGSGMVEPAAGPRPLTGRKGDEKSGGEGERGKGGKKGRSKGARASGNISMSLQNGGWESVI